VVVIRETKKNGEEGELGIAGSPRLCSAIDPGTEALPAGDVRGIGLAGRLTCREGLQPRLVAKRGIAGLVRVANLHSQLKLIDWMLQDDLAVQHRGSRHDNPQRLAFRGVSLGSPCVISWVR